MNLFLRHIAPFLLLASYLPMAVMSSLHVHHETIDAHDDCQQCVGHIEEAHHHEHDCLFCTFQSLSYFAQDCKPTAVLPPDTERICVPTTDLFSYSHIHAFIPRAPPTV